LQDPPKFSQIWIFGKKTNHLATLLGTLKIDPLLSSRKKPCLPFKRGAEKTSVSTIDI
jgi:hypothetical protein